jgi:hypothetical protein
MLLLPASEQVEIASWKILKQDKEMQILHYAIIQRNWCPIHQTIEK